MRNSTILTSVVIATTCLLMGGAFAQIGPPNILVSTLRYDPAPVESGGYFDLLIKVENRGITEANNVECALEEKYPFSLDPGDDEIRTIGILPPSEYALIEYRIRVDANAVDGNNDIRIHCSDDGLDDGSFFTKTLEININSGMPDFAIGLMKSVPDEIKAGRDEVKIIAEIQNIGEGDAKMITMDLMLPQEISPSTSYSDTYNLGYLEKDSSKEAIFYIDIKDGIKSGIYHAKMTIRYKTATTGDYLEKQLLLEINVRPSPNFIIREIRAGTDTTSDSFTGYILSDGVVVNPSTISQGGSGELRIILENNGEEEAKSVSVKIFKDSTQPFEFDEIYDFIGNINPGETGDAVFSFSVDDGATLKNYPLEIEVRYVEGNDVNSERETVSVDVSGQAPPNYLLFIPVLVVIIVAAFLLIRRK